MSIFQNAIVPLLSTLGPPVLKPPRIVRMTLATTTRSSKDQRKWYGKSSSYSPGYPRNAILQTRHIGIDYEHAVMVIDAL